MQRIDQHIVGILLGGRPNRQVAQVDQVTYPPRPLRPDAIQLRRVAPQAALVEPLGQAQEARSDDQGRIGLPPVGQQFEAVVAGRQVARDLEACLADQHVVDHPRGHQVLTLPQVAHLTGLQAQPDLRGLAVDHVCLDGCLLTLGDHHHRRQAAAPRFEFVLGDGLLGLVVGGRIDPHGRHDPDDGVVGYLGVPTLPIPELGGDPEQAGECHQWGLGDH